MTSPTPTSELAPELASDTSPGLSAGASATAAAPVVDFYLRQALRAGFEGTEAEQFATKLHVAFPVAGPCDDSGHPYSHDDPDGLHPDPARAGRCACGKHVGIPTGGTDT